MQDFNYIQIGKIGEALLQPKWVEKWLAKNKPEQSASIPMTNDGTLHWQNVDEWLRPEIDFTFNFLNANEYAQAEKILLLGAFVCRYYNPTIKKWFTGLFKLTDSSVALFLRAYQNSFVGVTNYSFKARSVFTYDNFEQMSEKADYDERF